MCIGQCHKDKSEWERWLKVCVWILMKPTRFPINSFIYVCLSRKFCIKFSWSCRHNLTNRSANYNENEFKNRNTVVIYTKASVCIDCFSLIVCVDTLTYIYKHLDWPCNRIKTRRWRQKNKSSIKWLRTWFDKKTYSIHVIWLGSWLDSHSFFLLFISFWLGVVCKSINNTLHSSASECD